MIDINELRDRAVTFGSDYLTDEEWVAVIDRLEAAEKAVTEAYQRGYETGKEELAAELEFAKREVTNLHDDIHELTDERDALRAMLEDERKEHSYTLRAAKAEAKQVDALRAKIEQMEKQEPIGEMLEVSPHNYELRWYRPVPFGAKLYALPGAKPQPSVPDTYAAGINAVAAMLQSKAAEYAKEHGHDDMGGLSFGSGMGGEIKMDYYTNLIELADDVRAMLAAAPETKP